jgi:hypothetical protein
MASETEDFESLVMKGLVLVPPRSRKSRKPAIATNAKRTKKKEGIDSIDGKGERKVAGDSSATPLTPDQKEGNSIGALKASMDMLTTHELYSTVNTSEGTFITRVAPKLSTRNWPKINTLMTPNRKLEPELEVYTDWLWLKYDAELQITSTIELSEGLGRGLCFIEQIAPAGGKEIWRLGFAPVEDGEIEYEKVMVEDENGKLKELASGKVIKYNPHVSRGMERIQLHIEPENAVLFKAEPDPYGNLEQGIPQTLGAYNTIKRVENIQDSTAKLYKRRGLGLLQISIEGADPEDCDEYAEEYGNPDEYTVMVTDERFKVENHAGITQGFDLSETISVYKEGLSEGTGYPQSAFQGNTEGSEGSESSSDTKETIIQTIQKRYQGYILKVLYMLDRKEDNKKLEDKKLYLKWEHTIKMDKQKEVNVKSTVAGYVNSVSTVLTVDEVREELGKPPHPDPKKGKMIYAEYKQEFAPDPFEPGSGVDPENKKPGEKRANDPTPAKFEERTVKNQLNKKDAIVRLFKTGMSFNDALSTLKDISSDGKAMNRTDASKLFQKVKKGEL